MNIVLINPKIKYNTTPLPPLGIAYLAAVLKENGYSNIKIIDAACENLENNKVIEKLECYKPDIVGISVMSNVKTNSLQLSMLIKKKFPDVMIAWGGAHATALPENCLSNTYVDIVFRNEAEYSFLEFVRLYETKKDFRNLPGISFRYNGGIVHNQKVSRIRDLDALPLPARELLPMEKYGSPSWFGSSVKSTMIFSSRGCPYECTYCANKVSWGDMKFMRRSAEKVVDEMEMLKESYGINGFQFSDECLTSSKSHVQNFCNEILKRNLNISWVCSSFAKNITSEIVKLLKKSGCEFINFGIESGSSNVRKRMKKFLTNDDIFNAVRLSKEAGLRVGCCFLLGCPDETVEEAKETINMAKRLPLDEVAFNIVVPFPGTEMFKKYVEPKNLDLNWDEAMGFDPINPDTPKVFFNCSKISDEQLISLYREARRKVELNFHAIKMNINRLRHATSFKHLLIMLIGGIKLLFKR